MAVYDVSDPASPHLVGDQLRHVATDKGRWLALAAFSGVGHGPQDLAECAAPLSCTMISPLMNSTFWRSSMPS